MSDPSERLRDEVAEVLASVLHERWCPLPSKCSWSADDWDEAAPLADALMPLLARVRAEAEQRGRAEALRLVRRVETDMADTAAKAWRSADARRGCSDHEALLVHADALTRWSERFRMAFDGEYYRADEVTP